MPTVDKPLLVYDGDCGFCRLWVLRWKILTGNRVDYEPSQKVAERFPRIKPERFKEAVWLIEPDRESSGAEAVFRVLSHATGRGWLLRAYRSVPGFAVVSEWFYRIVAGHRVLSSRLTRWLWGANLEPSTYCWTRWLFLRALGFIYLFAFVSLWVQADGLIGHNGILPAQGFLQAAREQMGPKAYHLFPTLCWIDSSDAFLHFLCGGGTVLSLLLILGLAPGPVLLALWTFYLSLTVIGRDFLSFQWDILLTETGFLAVFFAPWRFWPRLSKESSPPPAALWLLRWLLFRLMFESGCVKLLSGDDAWRSLTALYYHYETQPLPTWLGWYAHQLPHGFQKLSAAMMFAIEIGSPLLIFLPRRPRLLAFFSLVFLQTLISLTGNYCFFNLLALDLCLLLLDDAALTSLMPRALASRLEVPPARPSRLKSWMLAPLAAAILAVSGMQLYGMFAGRMQPPRALVDFYNAVEPFRTVNGYGLFAIMTTSRPEIIVEGSRDGKSWSAYEFKWKPGDLSSRPGFVEPHQPRLDWQMWFAALGSYRENPWFINLMARLLEGSPEVLALIAKNPFPDAPPKFARAVMYDYHFTALTEKRASGDWWKRDNPRPYCPTISLRLQP